MRLGTADVLVRAKTGKYKQDIAGAERRTETFGKRASASIGKITASLVAFSAVASTVFIAASLKAVDYGSDLEETQGKFDVVFRGMTETAEEWSDVMQKSYAMSETESKKYLSSIQDLLVPTGLARDKAGELSNQFVKMAADLGSFNNRETVEVVRDIQSALQGSSETMAKYGINVKAAKVEQEIYRLKLAKTKKEITDAHKAQAIYSIMLREGADAVGDMARTSESYANQLKKAKANIADISTEMGQNLLPLATSLVNEFNQWHEINKSLISQRIPEYLGYIGKAAVFVLDAISGVGRVFSIVGRGIAQTALWIEKIMLEWADTIVNGPVKALNTLIELYNKIPTLPDIKFKFSNFEGGKKIKDELDLVNGAIIQAEIDINRLFETPLAGTKLKNSFLEARQEAEKLSAATSGGSESDPKSDPFANMLNNQNIAQEKSKDSYSKYVEEMEATSKDLSNSVDSAFGSALKGIVRNFSEGSASLKDIGSNLLQELANSLLDYAMTAAKAQLLASQGGSDGEHKFCNNENNSWMIHR